MAKAKRTWRWVSRDNFCKLVSLWQDTKKPKSVTKDDDLWFPPGGHRVLVCADELAAVTGIKIKPGTCVKVQFSAKVVK